MPDFQSDLLADTIYVMLPATYHGGIGQKDDMPRFPFVLLIEDEKAALDDRLELTGGLRAKKRKHRRWPYPAATSRETVLD